jgi:hypothetical protein
MPAATDFWYQPHPAPDMPSVTASATGGFVGTFPVLKKLNRPAVAALDDVRDNLVPNRGGRS